MSRFLKYPLLLALPFALAACGQTSVECSNPEVAKVLGNNIIQNIDTHMSLVSLLGGVEPKSGELESMLAEFKPTLVAVATTQKDETINKRSCQAMMTFEFPETVYEKAMSGVKHTNLINFDIQLGIVPDLVAAAKNLGVELTRTSISSPITYTIQTSDDGRNFYTEGQTSGELGLMILRFVGAALAEQQAMKKVN
ncbi:hypothetical protein ACM5Q9_13940 [Advenella sp. RU8]|uniref:hypothetical protein n=1 Tax=Advenella sp. RU8 TaxID=3399575 RepID=UPI003AAE030B